MDRGRSPSNPGGEAVLSLEKVMKRRGRNNVYFELVVPSFTPAIGDFVAIVGPSGCGKSTMLDMLGLVLSPTSADAFSLREGDGQTTDVQGLWRGKSQPELARLRRDYIGYVLQSGGLFPFLSAGDNAVLPAQLKGLDGDTAYLQEFARQLGIDDQLGKKPQHLSGGQRQRVAILRALANQPRIILADEPTAAVDEKKAQDIVKIFRDLAKRAGACIIMVTHDLRLVEPVADRTFTFELQEVSDNTTRSTFVEKRGSQ